MQLGHGRVARRVHWWSKGKCGKLGRGTAGSSQGGEQWWCWVNSLKHRREREGRKHGNFLGVYLGCFFRRD